MILDDKPFDQLTREDVLALIPGVAENRRLDYKQALPQDGEKGARSFLNDVCALANSAGGFLLYGVDEELDDDGSKTGVPASVCGVGEVNEDKAILDWQQRINQSIEPRIIGHRVGFVKGFDDGKKVMLVFVPKSLLAPHRVTFKGGRDFYIRHDRGNQLMDINEIRAAFVDLASLPERLSEYRAIRLGKILADETPTPLVGGWTVVLHMIPLGSLGGEELVDITAVKPNQVMVIGASANKSRLNLDGMLFVATAGGESDEGYVQMFRNGIMEIVRSDPRMAENRGNGSDKTPLIASEWLEEGIIEVVKQNLAILAGVGVKPPVYIGLSLLRTRGLGMARKNSSMHFAFGSQVIDRDTVSVPFVVSESLTEDAGRLMKPAFDVLWQASGLPKSDYYDADGNWSAR